MIDRVHSSQTAFCGGGAKLLVVLLAPMLEDICPLGPVHPTDEVIPPEKLFPN